GGAVVEALRAELEPLELLLVLDNCEHLIGAAASLVDSLLRGTPRLTVLATTRAPLAVPREGGCRGASASPRGGRLPRPVPRHSRSGPRGGARGAPPLRGRSAVRRA